MQIVIVFYEFLSKAIKLVKIFLLKFLKINLNIVLEIIFFAIYSYILIELIYSKLIKNIIVIGLNVYTIVKEDF